MREGIEKTMSSPSAMPAQTAAARQATAGHDITAREIRNKDGQRRWVSSCSCGRWGSWEECRTKAKALKVAQKRHIGKVIEKQATAPASCPTPEKRRHGSKGQAEAAMRKFWRTGGKGKVMPCRAYKCPCGAWHTTARPERGTAS